MPLMRLAFAYWRKTILIPNRYLFFVVFLDNWIMCKLSIISSHLFSRGIGARIRLAGTFVVSIQQDGNNNNNYHTTYAADYDAN
jgi:hypothetical protein